MYAMDMRQYDPAIARWVVQDPVVHFDYSPYSAFDNNPVYWADPSGADSENWMEFDQMGRNRFDSNNMYIPMHERGSTSLTSFDYSSSFTGSDNVGGDTDYKVDKDGNIVRVDPNDKSKENTFDRILDEKGNIIIDEITKGILAENSNIRLNGRQIDFGLEGQPTLAYLVKFFTLFANKIAGVEISGFEAEYKNNSNQKVLIVEPYKGNRAMFATSAILYLNEEVGIRYPMLIKAHFHVHLTLYGDINKPSKYDIDAKATRFSPKNIILPHYIYNIHGRHEYTHQISAN